MSHDVRKLGQAGVMMGEVSPGQHLTPEDTGHIRTRRGPEYN